MSTRPSVSFSLRPPYTRGWDGLAQHLYDALVDMGYSPRQTDGELLVLFCLRMRHPPENPPQDTISLRRLEHLFYDQVTPLDSQKDLVPTEHFTDLVASALARLPQPVPEAAIPATWNDLWGLFQAVAGGKPSQEYTPLMSKWDMEDMHLWKHRNEPPTMLQPELLKWRHWKPRPDFHTELTHLLGDTRFRTLRQYCLAYEGPRKRGFEAIPWSERDVRALLNRLAEDEVTPYKLQQVWNTLKWFSKVFGLLNIDEVHRLKAKKQALEETLADTATKPQRKAVVPSREVVWALEEGAATLDPAGAPGPDGQVVPGFDRHKMMDAFILGLARFQLGCSARFNDLQHVHPRELHSTTSTIELQAWQTKTVSTARIKKHPAPLICPKYSFSGKDWWPGWVATIRKLCKLPKFQDMDYLIPTVSKDFNGIIARPSTPDRGLRWLKDALIRQGVGRDQRQYLGNWLSESTADVYTRELAMWWFPFGTKWQPRCPALIWTPAKRGVRTSITDWNDPAPVEIPDGEAPDEIPLEAHDTPESGKSSRWSVVGTQVDHPSPTELFPDLSQHNLRVVVTVAKATAVGLYRIHLLTDDGVAVGCGWRPKAGAITELTHLDFSREPEAYGKCTRCFKGHTFPATWSQDEEVVADAPVDVARTQTLALTRMIQWTPAQNKRVSNFPCSDPGTHYGCPWPRGGFPEVLPVILRKWRVCQSVLRKWRKISKSGTDPELHVIHAAIRTARHFLQFALDAEKDIFWKIIRQPIPHAATIAGPAVALKQYLLRIDWTIDDQGYIHTTGFCKFHLLNSNLHDILEAATDAWMTVVVENLSTRKHMRNTPPIDREATQAAFGKIPEKYKLCMGLESTGGFMLNTQKSHFTEEKGTCSYCDAEDSHRHRVLECPATQDARKNHALVCAQLTDCDDMYLAFPLALKTHEDKFLNDLLYNIPEPDVQMSHGPKPTWVYTDGSCYLPTSKRHRWAAFAIVYPVVPAPKLLMLKHLPPDILLQKAYHVAAVSIVPGRQTINRAELHAAVLTHEQKTQAAVVTDSAYVIHMHALVKNTPNVFLLHKLPHWDLLRRLHTLFWMDGYALPLYKIKAHQTIAGQTDLEILHIMGNSVADFAAKQVATHSMQMVTKDLRRLHADSMLSQKFLEDQYALRIDLAMKRTKIDNENEKSPEKQVQRLEQMHSWTLEQGKVYTFSEEDYNNAKGSKFGKRVTHLLLQWLQLLEWPTSPEEVTPPIGITWVELAVNYMVCTQSSIPVQPHQEEQGFTVRTNTFRNIIMHVQFLVNKDILPRVTPVKVKSLYQLGAKVMKQGLPLRPKLPKQEETLEILHRYFSEHGQGGKACFVATPHIPLMNAVVSSHYDAASEDNQKTRAKLYRDRRQQIKQLKGDNLDDNGQLEEE
eukprot:s2216_g8.t1